MSLSIAIIAGINASVSSVAATGNEFHVITPQEAAVFHIDSDSKLKDIAEKDMGKRPNDAYLRSATPWGDLYKLYGWQQVETHLTVQNADIQGVTTKTVIIDTKTLINKSSVKASFNAGISTEVTNTTESNWSNLSTFGFEQAVNYSIAFAGSGLGGSSTFSYSKTWGKGGSISQSTSVGSTLGVSVDLGPGQSVTAELIANRGTMNIRVNYLAHLEGFSALNYKKSYNGHHFWAMPISAALAKSGIPNSKQITEDIQIGFYSNSSIVIRDNKGKALKVYHFGNDGELLNMEDLNSEVKKL